jgi:fumarate reductase subunit D
LKVAPIWVKLYRPAACLTFGLNYYFGKLDPAGYHLVNIVVHFLTAVFLFLTILALFRSPRLRGGDPEKNTIKFQGG